MNNMCPNPGCGAVYAVSQQHVGRSMTCKKCGASLIVTADGIQLADAGAAAPPKPAVFGVAEDEPPVRKEPGRFGKRAKAFGGFLSTLADLPTWFFGTGAFLVIIFMFFPLINTAKSSRKQAQVTEGDIAEERTQFEYEQAEKKKAKTAEEDKERKKDKEAWEEKKKLLGFEKRELEAAASGANYLYLWGKLLGFLALVVGSIGYVTPSQPTTRRVIGAVVLIAVVLLVFIEHARVFRITIGTG